MLLSCKGAAFTKQRCLRCPDPQFPLPVVVHLQLTAPRIHTRGQLAQSMTSSNSLLLASQACGAPDQRAKVALVAFCCPGKSTVAEHSDNFLELFLGSAVSSSFGDLQQKWKLGGKILEVEVESFGPRFDVVGKRH